LPRGLEGLKIAHISDFHIKRRDSLRDEVVLRAGEMRPDLIAITGDFVESADYLGWCMEFVEQLRTVHGVYAVLGNWDHWMGQTAVLIDRLRNIGVTVLVNDHRVVKIGTSSLYIVGVDDPYTEMANFDCALGAALSRGDCGDPDSFVVLLAHSPEIFESARRSCIPLTLVGHTHGEGIRGLLVNGGSRMYVNPGPGSTISGVRTNLPAGTHHSDSDPAI
jgi:predicted MPP superfamily phosphohydrolase